ncbi:MAG: hypothetical protein IT581_23655 [Verrucomicrobiales bacterium]|nr:hypothetical protein [Verrucomicrobiales bacterium]
MIVRWIECVVGVAVVMPMAVAAASASLPGAAVQRAQQFSLQAGWNAIYLEVHPVDPDPANLFAHTPIDVAAAVHSRPTPAQFVTQPSVDLFRREGWGVWYAGDRPDAFLGSLFAIHGQQAYLVHAKEAFSWSVTGLVVLEEVRWKPEAFNLVGFSVSESAPPTFDQFFRNSKAHAHNRIYRLVDGSWRKVADPAAETMRSGEAFWIYCDGVSTYQGPLRVQAAGRRGLYLSGRAGDLILRNETSHPLEPTIEHLPLAGTQLPLSILLQGVQDPSAPLRQIATKKPAGSWRQDLPPLEADRAVRIPLAARVDEMAAHTQASLIRISTDLGTVTWVPVVGIREDLEEK